MRNTRDARAGRDSGTFLALAALLVAAIGLLFLVALVIPQVIGIAVVLACLVLFVTFHYVVWGWWLSGRIVDDTEKHATRWQPPLE